MWTQRRLVDDAARGDGHGGDGPGWVIDGPHEFLSDEFPYVGTVGLDVTVLRRKVGVAPVTVSTYSTSQYSRIVCYESQKSDKFDREKYKEGAYVDALLTRWADHASGQPD